MKSNGYGVSREPHWRPVAYLYIRSDHWNISKDFTLHTRYDPQKIFALAVRVSIVSGVLNTEQDEVPVDRKFKIYEEAILWVSLLSIVIYHSLSTSL